MKKLLSIFALAALLVTGCSKNDLQQTSFGDGAEVSQKITFTASLPEESQAKATKAVADNDGNGAYVNRCIMEIYYGDKLFTRMYAPVSNLKANFTVQIPSNRTYTIAFWADHVDKAGSFITEAELIADKFYTTNTDQGLKAVSLKGEYAGNDDKRDAFFYSSDYTVEQGGSSFDVTLKRPFSQINVITTDLQSFKQVPGLLPSNVDVTLNDVYTEMNLLTGALSESTDLNYTATLYNVPAQIGETINATLSMDYIFASTEKSAIDIDWKATKSGDSDIVYAFTNIPYQRNYRTNIKGNLLTSIGQWNVTIDPIWSSPDEDVEIANANDVQQANDALKSMAPTGSETKNIITVNVVEELQSNTTPTVGEWEGRPLEVPAAFTNYTDQSAPVSKVKQTYFNINAGVGSGVDKIIIRDEKDNDHAHDADRVQIVTLGYQGEVFITAPGLSSVDFDIQLSGATVYLNGTQISNALVQTGADTFVIAEDSEITGTLTVKKGNVALYGNVKSIVRDASNIDDYTYVYMYNETGWENIETQKHIASTRETKVIPVFPVAKIGNTLYPYLEYALADAKEGDVVELIRNIDFSSKYDAYSEHHLNMAGVTLDLKGYTITANNYSVIFYGSNATIKNGTFVSANNGSYAIFIGKESAETNDFIIDDVTCTGGINVYNSTVTIKSTNATSVNGTNYYALWADDNAQITVEGGSFNKEGGVAVLAYTTGSIQLKGGTYTFADEEETRFKSYVAFGYEATKQSNVWVVEKCAPTEAEVSVSDGTETVYSTLAAFRDATNAGNAFSGYTVTLLKDVDLNNAEWTPISNYAYGEGNGKLFAGIFDGDNHTISNFKIENNTQDALGNTEYVTNGFFGQVATCTIKNVKFDNVTVISPGMNAVVASLHTVSTGKLLMENVQVLSGTVTNPDNGNAGGLMCFVTGLSEYKNCVNYANVTGYGVGGIVGILRDGTQNNSCVISDCVNHGEITNTKGGGDGAGGIVSKMTNAGTISRCKNYGEVKGTVKNVYAGGIIGIADANSKLFTISDCINYADISSNAGEYGRAGGILGKFGAALTIERCINIGSITGYQGAGGISGWSGDSWGLVVKHSYNSGSVVCSNGHAGGIEQGDLNETVSCSLNNSSVTAGDGKTAVQIAHSSSNITYCYYYYDEATLKTNLGETVADVNATLVSLNSGLETPFWGKDGNNIIKPIVLIP